jgi:ABC-type glycerol-3-phosphate transport system substrate-binding protein
MKSSFQLTLIIACGFLAVIAVLMFAGYLPKGIGSKNKNVVQEVTLWGPFGGIDVDEYFNNLSDANKDVVRVKYVSQAPEDYVENLIEAFARGEGPDLFFVDQKMLNRLTGKTILIPYETYPQRDVLNNFADGSSVFMTSAGLKAIPLMIDPLVMYYNRTMYTSSNVVIPPKTWVEFLATIKPILQIDSRNNITRTAAAMGEFRNITNSKSLLSTLFLQSGNPIVILDANDNYVADLNNTLGLTPSPAEAAIVYYQQFSNPTQASYTWNRSMTNDKDTFAAENLATYFGFASELKDLRGKNPHLDLDAVVIPQKDLRKRVSYGDFYGAAISKNSKKQASAYLLAEILAKKTTQDEMTKLLGYLPARRDLLVIKDSDPIRQIFKDSATLSRSWVDPVPSNTNQIIQEMMEGIQTGQTEIGGAIIDANSKINRLFNSQPKAAQ